MECLYCELEVSLDEIDEHVDYCGSRIDRCKGCTKNVQLRFLQFHYESDHRYLSPDLKDKAEEECEYEEEEDECPICLGEVTLPLTLECGHVFCMVCVKGIANTTKNCAICRRDINRDMLMDIRFCREEDVIKNYVKNSKYKKNIRSRSVSSRRIGLTTQDYDSMVSALLSSRTATSNYRYQRPNNSHTPQAYTPYCYGDGHTTSTTTTCSAINPHTITSSSSDINYISKRNHHHQENCFSGSSKAPPPRQRRTEKAHSQYTTSSHMPCAEDDIPSTAFEVPIQRVEISNNSSDVYTEKPIRPSRLPLRENGGDSSQLAYDRWFAFQLAQTDDEVSLRESGSKSSKSPFRRSQSMPERENNDQSSLPPTSPRVSSRETSRVNTSHDSNTNSSSITKSSSDSSANENHSNSSNTGARPKYANGLKKRVSFKEETPHIKREAPVLLPCEFCEEMFPDRDLMRHQTSCEKNETKYPREYLLSRKSSPTSPLNSPVTSNNPFLESITTPTSSLSTTLQSPTITLAKNQDSSQNSEMISNQLQTPHLYPSHSHLTHPLSPKGTLLGESFCSPLNSRNNSVSPGAGISVNSSSGIGSGISSISNRSSSSTPSTSSSGSPILKSNRLNSPGTPTDIEIDFESDTSNFVQPRKGKLISSAIASWRTISGSKYKDPTFARSSTAPLDGNTDQEISSPSTRRSMCHSASRLDSSDLNTNFEQVTIQNRSRPTFVRLRKKYNAPMPPHNANKNAILPSDQTGSNEDQGIVEKPVNSDKSIQKTINTNQRLKFDSVPIMNGLRKITGLSNSVNTIVCKFCKQNLPQEDSGEHENECKIKKSKSEKSSHSTHEVMDNKDVIVIPVRRNKGPAPPPPHGTDENRRRDRPEFVRECLSETRDVSEIDEARNRSERASSIKESPNSLSSSYENHSRNRYNRDGVYGSSLDCSAIYTAGRSLSSSSSSLNNYKSSLSFTSHTATTREETRSRRSSLNYVGSIPTTTPFFGATRYRERTGGRHRPSSLYSSRNAFTIMADSFAALNDKPVVRKKKKQAPQPPENKRNRKFRLKTIIRFKSLAKASFR